MRITVCSLFDDNFGDMLIRICTVQILRCVFRNLGELDSLELGETDLKNPDFDLLLASDVILVPGGAVVGVAYTKVHEYLERLFSFADEHSVPVVLSAVGMNHDSIHDDVLLRILSHPCIRSITARDSVSVLQAVMAMPVERVSDPACWSSFIYPPPIKSRGTLVGINVIRGGIFKSNGIRFSLEKEQNLLWGVSCMLRENGYDVCFFTNGSTLDENALMDFKERFQIPDRECRFIDSTRSLVQVVASFDAVLAFRMHAAVISYSYGIPFITLAWNPKIIDFCDSLGIPDCAVVPSDWDVSFLFSKLNGALSKGRGSVSEPYLMSLYVSLYSCFQRLCRIETAAPPWSFAEVCAALADTPEPSSEDSRDMLEKIRRGRDRYFLLFKKNCELRNLVNRGSAPLASRLIKRMKRFASLLKKHLSWRVDA